MSLSMEVGYGWKLWVMGGGEGDGSRSTEAAVEGEVASAVEVDRRQMGAAGGRLRPADWAARREQEPGRRRAAENTCRPSVTTQTDET